TGRSRSWARAREPVSWPRSVREAIMGQGGSGRSALGLPDDAQGVLPSQALARAVELGWISAGDFRIPAEQVQPASVDLRLGEVAWRIRSSFLPDKRPVEV